MTVRTTAQLQQDLVNQLSDKPFWDAKNNSWTCPEGYAYPRCSGCGHNFYESKPVLVRLARSVGGLCHWCISEMDEEED